MNSMYGKVFTNVTSSGDELLFSNDKESYKFYHPQSCCEDVHIESIVGELTDLLGSPILMAEESIGYNDVSYGTEQWTFYKFATIKGYVDVRWVGTSNGYYSTSVDMEHTL